MGRSVEMAVGVVEGGIWAVGSVGIRGQAQGRVNGQGEAQPGGEE